MNNKYFLVFISLLLPLTIATAGNCNFVENKVKCEIGLSEEGYCAIYRVRADKLKVYVSVATQDISIGINKLDQEFPALFKEGDSIKLVAHRKQQNTNPRSEFTCILDKKGVKCQDVLVPTGDCWQEYDIDKGKWLK